MKKTAAVTAHDSIGSSSTMPIRRWNLLIILQYVDDEPRRTIDTLGRLLEIGFGRLVDIDELLGIAIDKRKPGALHLDHQAVPFPEGVKDVRHDVLDVGQLAGRHRFGFRVA